jgi:hypothetical protein
MATIAGRQMLKIAGMAAFAGSALLLASDLVHIFIGLAFEWTIGLFLAMALMTAATVGFTYLVSSRAGLIGIIGGCFAFFGLVAGAGMQALFRVHAVLEEQGSMQVVAQLQQSFKLVAATQMIGLSWPIGALLLGIASMKAWPGQFLLPLLFAAGAISFPIGRIAGNEAAIILSGIFFMAAYWIIGTRLFAAAEEE